MFPRTVTVDAVVEEKIAGVTATDVAADGVDALVFAVVKQGGGTLVEICGGGHSHS